MIDRPAGTARARLASAACVGITGVLLGASAASPAYAAPPEAPGNLLVLEKFHDEASFLSEDGEEWECELGFAVQYDLDASGTFWLAPRGRHGLPYSHGTVHGSETWQANGHTFTHTFSANFKDLTVVDEGRTLLITAQGAGNDRVYVDGKLTLRNPGTNWVQFRVDHNGSPSDPFDDDWDNAEFVGVVKPSTGLNETGDLCEDLAFYLAAD